MLTERYQDDILGTNGCCDRIIVSGSLVPISYETGLLRFLSAHNILLKEFESYKQLSN